MAKTEAQKRARDKWNRKHTAAIAAAVRVEEKESFRAACEKNGTTPNAVLRDFIRTYIEQNGKEQN